MPRSAWRKRDAGSRKLDLMRRFILIALLVSTGSTVRALEAAKADPYLGAIALEASTGAVLIEDSADKRGYPASIVKLMGLLIALERIEAGEMNLEETVHVTPEAARMGGSQVYLKEGEVFSVDDMLYAVMIQSANDAAVAMAIHMAGSKEAFAAMMNQRAKLLGMDSTEIHSVHGLPPGRGQKPDVSTPRDIARLAAEVVKHPLALKYTSARERGLRDGAFIMRTHNTLLDTVPGCDGLKTGYFRLAGFSIAATAAREGRRVIAVVLGSIHKQARNEAAAELIERAFLIEPTVPPLQPDPVVEETGPGDGGREIRIKPAYVLLALGAIVALSVTGMAVFALIRRVNRRRRYWFP